MHLPLRPIFRQLPPNFIDVRTAYASEIWAQLTKNLLAKSSTKRFREYILCYQIIAKELGKNFPRYLIFVEFFFYILPSPDQHILLKKSASDPALAAALSHTLRRSASVSSKIILRVFIVTGPLSSKSSRILCAFP